MVFWRRYDAGSTVQNKSRGRAVSLAFSHVLAISLYSIVCSLLLGNSPNTDSAAAAVTISFRIAIATHVQDFHAMSSDLCCLSPTTAKIEKTAPFQNMSCDHRCLTSKAMVSNMQSLSCRVCSPVDTSRLLPGTARTSTPAYALGSRRQQCSEPPAGQHSSSALHQPRRHKGWTIARVGECWYIQRG